MPPLADMQREFARGLMAGDVLALEFRGAIPAQEAMRVYRNTVIGALVGAIRISYPSIDALVGEETFDAMAAAFAEAHPPRSARLIDYGEGFATFVGQACPLAYLADVGRLDWAVERAAQAPAGSWQVAIDTSVSLELPESLTALRLEHPADVIRAALDDDAALAAVDLAAGPRFVAIWRDGGQVHVRGIGLCAGPFLSALLESGSASRAFAAALDLAPQGRAVTGEIQADIFAAPFCKVISKGSL